MFEKLWFALMIQDRNLMRLEFTRKWVKSGRFMHDVLVPSGCQGELRLRLTVCRGRPENAYPHAAPKAPPPSSWSFKFDYKATHLPKPKPRKYYSAHHVPYQSEPDHLPQAPQSPASFGTTTSTPKKKIMDGDGAAAETVEQMQARHRKEAKDLQGRVTSKKKNATKKTRKGVNDECAEMERKMKERQAEELEALVGDGGQNDDNNTPEDDDEEDGQKETAQSELAAKMRAMGVSELAAKPPQQPSKPPDESSSGNNGAAVGGGAGAGKKRNRQKERLARRAAEQEAAAEAAEQEAAGMTDHRGVERERMGAEFARHGLEEHEIRPDGHCLFSAVADQLGQAGVPVVPSGVEAGEGEQPGYKTVRRAAAGYIEAHGDDFAGFLEEDLGSYVRKIRDTAEWGGQLELLALASVYGVEVCVVQDGRTEVIQPNGGGEVKDGEERKKIWLAYYRHGYGLGEHYNSLRRKA